MLVPLALRGALGSLPLPRYSGKAEKKDEDGRGGEAGDLRIAPRPAPKLLRSTGGPGQDRFVAREPIEFLGQLLRAVVATRWLFLQTLKTDRGEVGWDGAVVRHGRN